MTRLPRIFERPIIGRPSGRSARKEIVLSRRSAPRAVAASMIATTGIATPKKVPRVMSITSLVAAVGLWLPVDSQMIPAGARMRRTNPMRRLPPTTWRAVVLAMAT